MKGCEQFDPFRESPYARAHGEVVKTAPDCSRPFTEGCRTPAGPAGPAHAHRAREAGPIVLTAVEACHYLRLLGDGADCVEPADALRVLHRLVAEGRLRPVAGFKRHRFTDVELARFVIDQTEAFEPRRVERRPGGPPADGTGAAQVADSASTSTRMRTRRAELRAARLAMDPREQARMRRATTIAMTQVAREGLRPGTTRYSERAEELYQEAMGHGR